MPEPSRRRLEELAWSATVQLHAWPVSDEARVPMWGTGFFIAPGTILTCAHVLRGRLAADPARTFAVRGEDFNGGQPAEARLERMLCERGADVGRPIPFEEDLALVRLVDDSLADSHECVWIADWTAPALGARHYVCGYKPDAAEVGGPWKGLMTINVEDGSHGMRTAPEAQLAAGLSGSPVIDPERGAVVGVLKSRRAEQDGGAAVTISALRGFDGLYAEVLAAHDAWHDNRRERPGNWVDWQMQGWHTDSRPDDPDRWTPADRRTACGLLARLRDPEGNLRLRELETQSVIDTLVRVANARPRSLAGSPRLRAWRDGLGEFYEGSGTGHLGAAVPLTYLTRLAEYLKSCEIDTTELVEWLERRGAALGPGSAPDAAPYMAPLPAHLLAPTPVTPGETPCVPYRDAAYGGAVVVLELERVSLEAGLRFYWTIAVDHGADDRQNLDHETGGRGVAYEDLVHRLSGPLAEAFRDLDIPHRPVPLEVVLDAEQFDVPVHQWQLNRTAELHRHDEREPLGVRRPVVVRRLGRPGDRLWRERWSELHRAERVGAFRLPPRGVHITARRALDIPAHGVPVLCRSAAGDHTGATAVRLLLEGGHGMALWHTRGHREQPCGTTCDTLHGHVDQLLGAARRAEYVPFRVWQLRREIAGQSDPHPAGPLALLYDDPSDVPDDDPMDSPL